MAISYLKREYVDMYAIGLDFGTLSARALLVEIRTGKVAATAVSPYQHAVIDSQLPGSRVKLDPDWALQHPQDWLDGMTTAVRTIMTHVDDPAQVVGIGMDFTACTVLPVTVDGMPCCQLDKWRQTPNAWPKLWKHHAAQEQANRITAVAAERDEPWLKRYGGIISSEWLLPKGLQIIEEDPTLYAEMDALVEAGDWVVWQLTGQFARNACAAGFKGLWHKVNGYPDADYLKAVHPQLADFYTAKGRGPVVAAGTPVGNLNEAWANTLGLTTNTVVAAGIIDAHAGAIGAGVTENNVIYMAMGTSTCHMLVAEQELLCEGISGVVEDGILPGRFGYEAGQAGVGDIFNWFTQHVDQSHETLTAEAAKLRPGESGLLALDWWNGCRTPLVDAELSGALIGYRLRTTTAEVYRALIEATAFGTRLILDTFAKGGVPVKALLASGGLTKNELLLQIYADVTGVPIKICPTEQASGLGAAILGALAGGGFESLETAVNAIAPTPSQTIMPQLNHRTTYDHLYAEYIRLVDWFGREDNSSPLKRLGAIRSR
ncbi:MAG: ribulokinase [Chloroflexi bacterium]|nr:ribulokinase [Chloroflexota bacterium]